MHTQKIRVLFLMVCVGCLFLCSCGLDDYFVIEPPTSVEVKLGQDDPDKMVYQLTTITVNALDSSQISMKGTAVYYRLVPVDQAATLDTEIAAIRSANTEYSENGILKLFSYKDSTTQNRLYSRMLFGSSEFLSTSGTSAGWKMTVNGTLTMPSGSEKLKLLTAQNGNTYVDVYVDKPSVAGEYYINAYAVTVGDVSLQEHYSQLAPLGVLKFTISD